MKRRESIKTMLVSGLAGGAIVSGCAPEEKQVVEAESTPIGDYGRTEKEKARDTELMADQYFSEQEMGVIAILCDLILPGKGDLKAATEAEVPDFIEFIVKDMPDHQLPIRGGIMWLNNFSNETFSKSFLTLSESEQKQLLDQIAYPDEVKPELNQGANFFSLIRNLTLTGYYTSKIGVEELGYKGNMPNVWDGVPEEVLKEHRMAYEEEWLKKCVDQNTRDELAQWDDEGNLLS